MDNFQKEIKNLLSDLVKVYRKGEEEPCGGLYVDGELGFAITLGTGIMNFGDVKIELIKGGKIISEPIILALVEKNIFETQKYYNAFAIRISYITSQMLTEYYENDENTFEQEENYV